MPLIHDKKLTETPPVLIFLRSFFSRFDLLQILPATVLLLTGVLFIYGTGQQIGGIYALHWERQVLWIGIGVYIAVMLGIGYLSGRKVKDMNDFLVAGRRFIAH